MSKLSGNDVTFESADAADIEGIVMAVQLALCGAMRKFVQECEKDLKAPGMTWEQIHFLINSFEKKKALIIEQQEPM